MSKIELFFVGLLSGILMRFGVPDIGDLILQFWSNLSKDLLYILSPDLHIYITIIAIIVFIIAGFFLFQPLIEGFQHGLEGIILVIIAIIIGFVLAGIMIGYYKNLMGLP